MPISSPSYFPAVRGTDAIIGLNAGSGATGARDIYAGQSAGANTALSDSVIMGSSALSAGVTDTTNIPNAVVIGSQAAAALINGGTSSQIVGGIVVIGKGALNAQQFASASVVIGAGAAALITSITTNPFGANVIVGTEAIGAMTATGGRRVNNSVVMGYRAYYGSLNPTAQGLGNSVVIGSQAAGNLDLTGSGDSNLNNVVCIGASAMLNVVGNTAAGSVVIGANANGTNPTDAGSDQVIIGRATRGTGTGVVMIGATSICGPNCVVLGSSNIAIGTAGARNVVIGYNADSGETASNSDRLIVATNTSVLFSLLYGYFAVGNLMLSNWSQANRAQVATIAGTNQVWVPNGTRGAGNPVGGGFFYVTAGALHYVGTAGTDTAIAPA